MRKKLVLILSITIVVSAVAAVLLVRLLMPAAPKLLLVYKIDIAAAVRQKAMLLAGDLEDDLRARNMKARVVQDTSGDLRVTSNVPDELDEVRALIAERYEDVFTAASTDGSDLTLALSPDVRGETIHHVVDQAVQVGRQRLLAFTPQAGLYLRNGAELHIELPELPAGQIAALKRIMQRSGTLEFRLVDDESALLLDVAMRAKPEVKISVKQDQYDGKHLGLVSYTSLVSKDLDALEAFIEQLPPKMRPPVNREILLGEGVGEDADERIYETYLVHRRAVVSGSHITDAEVQWDDRTGRPEVALTFSKRGGRLFAKTTEDNVGRRLAIVLDRRVSSAPVIQGRISGGRARITLGGFKDPLTLQREAKDLVAVLRAGSLPAKLVLLEEKRLSTL